jgi:hypothetical protein
MVGVVVEAVVEFGFKGGTLEDPAVVAVRPTLVVR